MFFDSIDATARIISILLSALSGGLLAWNAYLLVRSRQAYKKGLLVVHYRHRQWLVFALLCGLIGFGFYELPGLLFGGHAGNGSFGTLSAGVRRTLGLGFLTFTLFAAYVFQSCVLLRKDKKPIAATAIISIVSGLSNSAVIFILNQAFQDTGRLNDWAVFFAIALIVTYTGNKIARFNIIRITNDIIFEARSMLLANILRASYRRFEQLDKARIHSTLSSDTVVISTSANTIVQAVSSAITLLFCFAYMAFLDVYMLLVSLVIILFAASVFYLYSRQARVLWEQNRDVMNNFFGFVDMLLQGFKELVLQQKKADGFRDDMTESFENNRRLGARAEYKMANVGLFGDLIFVLIIGAVVFLYPLLFNGLDQAHLMTIVFLFLYITGPVTVLINVIPEMMRLGVSYGRIQSLIHELSANSEAEPQPPLAAESFAKLSFSDVCYSYTLENSSREFTLGPINVDFEPGRIHFIIGGNGTGKTTLAKLITGLYAPDSGLIAVNGRAETRLGEYFSVIFSDYYLFGRMYGIDYEGQEARIGQWLTELELSEKLAIEDGQFDGRGLSTGQRKRLALLLSVMEDKPIVLFDEWASDQDPRFKKYFYTQILPDLRSQGKCIIIITHDDSYYHLADKLFKMDAGQLKEVRSHEASSFMPVG